MKPHKLVLLVVLFAALGAGAAWWTGLFGPHEHAPALRYSADEGFYWTCPMHPQVRLGEAGNCPICGMKLVKRQQEPEAASAGEREVLYWYDPMRPDVRFDAPGKSPFMDMQLVPKYADEAAAHLVEIDPRMVQNLGMRTATVELGTLSPRIDSVGRVIVDERRLTAVEARAPGWVERLHVRAEGDPVRRGQLLAEIYAPELLAAQEEFVVALEVGERRLVEAARDRLLLFGVSEAQIDALAASRRPKRRIEVYAPVGGYVTELAVREGAQVAPGTPLFRLADLSRVWVTADVTEAQADRVAAGQHVEVRLPAIPGRTFDGSVEFVYPQLDVQTRTLRARAAIDNPQLALKPGMYADVAILPEPQPDVLLAPQEAVIRTGRRTVVIVAEGAGRFRPVEVEVGGASDGRIAVLAGLEAGQRVVTSGQFLIDSEASLLGAYDRLGGDPPAGRIREVGARGTGHGAEANSPSINRPRSQERQP